LIAELQNPADRSEWRGIPAGFAKLSPFEERLVGGATIEVWTGNLVVRGIYVTIETTLGRDGLLAVARALKPV
jgi:hypothetical protein